MKMNNSTSHPHHAYRIAPIDADGVEANQALYDISGCKSGVFLSKILNNSVFRRGTKQPIPDQFFLTQVEGPGPDHEFLEIGNVGMVRTPKVFLGDPVPFPSI